LSALLKQMIDDRSCQVSDSLKVHAQFKF